MRMESGKSQFLYDPEKNGEKIRRNPSILDRSINFQGSAGSCLKENREEEIPLPEISPY